MLSQLRPLKGQAVYVWRPERAVAIAAKVPNAKVISHDKQEVRSRAGSGSTEKVELGEEQGKEAGPEHRPMGRAWVRDRGQRSEVTHSFRLPHTAGVNAR